MERLESTLLLVLVTPASCKASRHECYNSFYYCLRLHCFPSIHVYLYDFNKERLLFSPNIIGTFFRLLINPQPLKVEVSVGKRRRVVVDVV